MVKAMTHILGFVPATETIHSFESLLALIPCYEKRRWNTLHHWHEHDILAKSHSMSSCMVKRSIPPSDLVSLPPPAGISRMFLACPIAGRVCFNMVYWHYPFAFKPNWYFFQREKMVWLITHAKLLLIWSDFGKHDPHWLALRSYIGLPNTYKFPKDVKRQSNKICKYKIL